MAGPPTQPETAGNDKIIKLNPFKIIVRQQYMQIPAVGADGVD
jgi:hypothetical protein